MAYICESCRKVLQPDDHVIASAELVDVTSQVDATPQIVEGSRLLWHSAHWRDQPGHRKVDEGFLHDLV